MKVRKYPQISQTNQWVIFHRFGPAQTFFFVATRHSYHIGTPYNFALPLDNSKYHRHGDLE